MTIGGACLLETVAFLISKNFYKNLFTLKRDKLFLLSVRLIHFISLIYTYMHIII